MTMFIEIPSCNANSVDPVQTPRSYFIYKVWNPMSRVMGIRPLQDMRTVKIKVSIRAGWSESVHSVPREDSDQTARMRSLIWVFPGRTGNLIENAVPRLIFDWCTKCSQLSISQTQWHKNVFFFFLFETTEVWDKSWNVRKLIAH